MKNKNKTTYIHFAIGMAIMILFRFIPLGVLPNVTDVGLQIMGVFIGTIYLWSTIDPMIASLASIIMMTMCDFGGSGAVLKECFGNPTVVQMFYLQIFMGGLTNRKLTIYIARWIMTRKFIEGKPWMFTFVMLFGTYTMAVFIGAFAPIFLFWPVLYGVFDEVGFKKTDAYPKMMIIGIVIAALIGFPVPPYMANGFALLNNYRNILPNFPALQTVGGLEISNATYFLGCFSLGLLLIIVVVMAMKYIFRPDVTPLKQVTVEMIKKNPLPPMNQAQKIYGIFLCIFIFVMLVPSLLPNVPILSFLNTNSLSMALILCAILILIRTEDGPVLKFAEVMGKDFAWPTFYLCTSAILLGTLLTRPETGVTPFLNALLSPIFGNMSGMMFMITILIVAVVLTNICNSLVIGMILQPVILTYCANAAVSPAPFITLMIFTVLLSAACTPAASPFAAMLFGNKEYLTSGDVYKYTTVFVGIELVIIIVIGIPFISMLF